MLTPEDIEYLEDCECKGYHTTNDRRWFHAKVRAQAERIERLEQCLSWMLANYKLTLASKPVRDVPECFAAAEAALAGGSQ